MYTASFGAGAKNCKKNKIEEQHRSKLFRTASLADVIFMQSGQPMESANFNAMQISCKFAKETCTFLFLDAFHQKKSNDYKLFSLLHKPLAKAYVKTVQKQCILH